MFSFFIGLGIALFIAIAGFGGFLFKLSNANKEDMENSAFDLPEMTKSEKPSAEPLSEMEAEDRLSRLEAPLSKPDFSSGTY